MGAPAVHNRPEDLDDRCLDKYDWLENRFGQNPCEVARVLIDLCQPRSYYALPALDLEHEQTHYPSPNPPQASSCQCSMGVYNLVQGCAACQQEGGYESTLWTDWVSNCTMSNINGGLVFPYACPAETEIPDWAWENNANGALSVGQVFRNAYGDGKSAASSSSSVSSTTSAPSTSSTPEIDYTEMSGKHSISKVSDGGDDASTGGSGSNIGTIVGVVVPIIIVGALVGAVLAYLRKKKRKFKRRGHRLDSSSDLPEPGAGVFGSGSSASTAAYSGGLMKQKDSRVSVFARPAPSERSSAARSFATNSVSTGMPVGAYNRDSALYTPSTGFDTLTRSSGLSYDLSDESYHDHEDDAPLTLEGDDDDSISPFSDIHRPAPSRVSTRNNIHTIASSARSYSSFSLSASTTHSPSLLSQESECADATSLFTTASSRGAPPSSSGATYGGAHDDDDEDGGSLRERR
ncbi:hypothetical protein JCM10450v2_003636 [Rhodotorula kratochvilovae]